MYDKKMFECMDLHQFIFFFHKVVVCEWLLMNGVKR